MSKSRTIVVWRIECPATGLGIYIAQNMHGTSPIAGLIDGRSTNRRPGIRWQERARFATCHHRFAFPSRLAMYRWFSPRVMSKLRRHGAVVRQYEVPESGLLHRDRHQVVFCPKQARLVA